MDEGGVLSVFWGSLHYDLACARARAHTHTHTHTPLSLSLTHTHTHTHTHTPCLSARHEPAIPIHSCMVLVVGSDSCEHPFDGQCLVQCDQYPLNPNTLMNPKMRPRIRIYPPERTGRFNERLVLSLATNQHCLLLDDELNILPTSSLSASIKPLALNADGTPDVPDASRQNAAELADLKTSLADTQVLFSACADPHLDGCLGGFLVVFVGDFPLAFTWWCSWLCRLWCLL